MRRTVPVLLSCTLVLAGAGAAQAAEGGGGASFTMMGKSTCAGWPKRGKLESAAKAVPLNWVLGFVSGEADKTDPRLLDLIDPDKVGPWLDRYCEANPSANLPSAGRALIADLSSQLPPPPKVEAPMFVPTRPAPPPAVVAQTEPKAAPARAAAVRRPAAPKRPAAPRPRTATAAAPAARPAAVAPRPAAPALRPALPAPRPAPAPARPAPKPAPAKPANPFWPFNFGR